MIDQFWNHCVETLKKEIPAQQIKLWIEPLSVVEFNENDGNLSMAAPNRFKLDWVLNNYSGRFNELASEFFGCPIQIRWQVAAKPNTSQGQYAAPSTSASQKTAEQDVPRTETLAIQAQKKRRDCQLCV